MAWFGATHARRRRRRRAGAGRRRARRLLRPRPCAAGRELRARARRAGHRRPQRHGQDDALQRDHRPGAGARQRPPRGRGDPRPGAATRSRSAASPTCRRAGASGRRCRVDETLRLVGAGQRREVERVYAMFPRLAERTGNGGAQLSGGEQQMLAIGRALLLEPRLLVMDEPTEGLAPVIVEQVVEALRGLAAESEIAVLLIEQNLGVAIDVADRIGVMVNGRIAQRDGGGRARPPTASCRSACSACARAAATTKPRRCRRRAATRRRRRRCSRCAAPMATARRRSTTWRRARCAASTAGTPAAPRRRWPTSRAPRAAPAAQAIALRSRALDAQPSPAAASASMRSAQVFDFPVAASSGRAAYVAGTFDTKGRELSFLRQCLEKLGLRVVTVDLSTSGKPSPASVHPREVARHHPRGRGGGLHRRPRQRGHGDGAGLRALRRARGATSAA